jgi:DNA-directed RNA polymerase subunit RPC12/RpoP
MDNIVYTCAVCGKEVYTYRSPKAQEDHTPKYCSIKCIGIAQRGEGNPAYNGGRYKLVSGYVVIFKPDHPHSDVKGCILEHRLVMEQMLGRYLTPEEVVHHKNHTVDDNRPKNLRLFANQSEHSKFHAMERRKRRSVA